MNIEQAIEIIGGKDNLRLWKYHEIAGLIRQAKKNEEVIDDKDFEDAIDRLESEALRNRARNALRNSAMLTERQKKSGSLQKLLDEKENEHHHFMP